MPTLKDIVERSDTPIGRVFDLSIQFFIILSLIAFSVETLPGLDPGWARLLHFFEIASITVFSVEYLVRLLVADRKIAFMTSFFGVVDLLAILPFYLSFGFDLRSIRALRLLRLFWMLKLVRYSRAIQRFHRAFLISREEIVLFFFVTVILLYLASVGIYHFEHAAQPEAFASVFHCLWWAVVTLTTVGYGDVYPITAGGRIFTFAILLIGLGVVSVPAGLVASALAQAREMESE
ncbi:Cyclic nucleotide-gated potassium channel [Rosistilla carotiformis]|uniref:Cyclic nucleotide-gated potassium channel n=1 Tax=Rosistilla carotiformis TaxID=2528017 RepID=A0A518JYI4_9BACT|nr:ion transporter [Rosistilla carotiformis]QDV70599.1 Cyclic nucleotide-gated potassium channel [Rosistilla carotiformis]